MKTYISILRGINVSGHKIIKMDALRNLYENMGFSNVTTYVQSGNVIFSGQDIGIRVLEKQIYQQIEKEFGFQVPVILLSIEMLKHIIDNNPFVEDNNKDKSFFHVTFLSSIPEKYDSNIIKDKKQDDEDIAFSNYAVYLYCPNGYGRTKLTNNFIESKLKVGATTRNWKTTQELLKIAEQII